MGESLPYGPGTIRTCDRQVRSLVLYPLSYGPLAAQGTGPGRAA